MSDQKKEDGNPGEKPDAWINKPGHRARLLNQMASSIVEQAQKLQESGAIDRHNEAGMEDDGAGTRYFKLGHPFVKVDENGVSVKTYTPGMDRHVAYLTRPDAADPKSKGRIGRMNRLPGNGVLAAEGVDFALTGGIKGDGSANAHHIPYREDGPFPRVTGVGQGFEYDDPAAKLGLPDTQVKDVAVGTAREIVDALKAAAKFQPKK